MLPILINSDPSKIDPFLALSTENYSLNGELTQASAPFHFSFNYAQQASQYKSNKELELLSSKSMSAGWFSVIMCNTACFPVALCHAVTCSQGSWNPLVLQTVQKIRTKLPGPLASASVMLPTLSLHRIGWSGSSQRDKKKKSIIMKAVTAAKSSLIFSDTINSTLYPKDLY